MIVKVELPPDKDLKQAKEHQAVVYDKDKSFRKLAPVTDHLLLAIGRATVLEPKCDGSYAYFNATMRGRDVVIHDLAKWQDWQPEAMYDFVIYNLADWQDW